MAPGAREVLVVDDDDSVREMICAMFRELGLECDTAADGVEALELIRRHHIGYAVILLDLQMPRMDGHGVVRELRSASLRQRSIVLVMTGACDVRELAIDGEVVQLVLPKPLAVREVGEIVHSSVSLMGSL